MRRTLCWIILVSVAARLVLVWTGACEGELVADDAYYYFTIARNVAHGFGSTFDRISITNGFHPLWLLSVVPLFRWTSDLWTPVRGALTLALAFDVISGLIIINLARRLWHSARAATIAGGLWFLFPLTALLGLRGMEASESTAFVLASLWLVLLALRSGLTWRTAVLCGAAVGLAGLSRTDNLPTVGLAVAATVALSPRARASRARAMGWLAVAGAAAAVVVAPWFIWNLRRFGQIVQVSGLVKLHTHELFGTLLPWGNSLSDHLRALAHRLLAPVLTPVRFTIGNNFHASAATEITALGVAALYAVPIASRVRALIRDADACSIVVFAATWLVVNRVLFGFVWQFSASWYGLPALALLTVLTAASLAALIDGASPTRAAAVALLGGFLVAAVAVYALFFTRVSQQPRGPEHSFDRRLTAAATNSPGAVIGTYNAGRLGYIAEKYDHLRVVNLDGLVNNKVYEAVEKGRYLEYVTRTVDILWEPPERAPFLEPSELRELESRYKKRPDGMWHRTRRDTTSRDPPR